MKNNLHLLDYLAKECDCQYVSDLKFSSKLKVELRKLLDDEKKEFSLTNWNDLISYLESSEQNFTSIEKAKEYVQKNLI
ncbi:hypothetical protein [Anaerorhabdus sp.]|uniref:hypothetical protein n=2 Tax=Anaerorhabdus sp. TaxID=1872524 RepID=UPI002FC83897